MENNGANLHVKSYVVDATTQKLDKIILSDGTEIAADGLRLGMRRIFHQPELLKREGLEPL